MSDTRTLPDDCQTIARSRVARKPRAPRGWLLALPSGRTGEGRRLREFRQALIDHIGKPSAPQMVLIDRATSLQRHLTMLDRKMLAGDVLSDHAARAYMAWSNSLTRTMRALRLDPSKPHQPSLDDYLEALDG